MKKINNLLFLFVGLMLSLISNAQETIVIVDPKDKINIGEYSSDFKIDIQCQYKTSGNGFYLCFDITEPTNLYIELDKKGTLSVSSKIDGKRIEKTVDSNYYFLYTEVDPQSCELLIYGYSVGSILNIKMQGSTTPVWDIFDDPEPLPEPFPEPPAITDPAMVQFSSNANYIATFTPLKEISSVEYKDGKITNYSAGNIQVDITYMDGMGRPFQYNKYRSSPENKDLISIVEYDRRDLVSQTWLPATFRGNGACYEKSAMKNRSIITNNDHKAFYETVFEKSSFHRKVKEILPGQYRHDFQKGVSNSYTFNQGKSTLSIADTDLLVCAKYILTGDNKKIIVSRTENYLENDLFVTCRTDEDGNINYQFKNKLDQVVLIRQINENKLIDTYFLYDAYGNLGCVLPPIAVTTLTSGSWDETNTTLKQYAYLYKYDNRQRCIAKKIPGADWVYYIYDRTDQLIFSQDGIQRSKGEWHFSVPDALGRMALTGICRNNFQYDTNPLANSVIQAEFNLSNINNKYYDIRGVTLTGPVDFLSAHYYDQYDFRTKEDFPKLSYDTSEYNTRYGDDTQTEKYKHKGLQTGSLVKTLNAGSESPTYIYTMNYYDNRKRMIQSHSTNHKGGIEKQYTAYNFSGQPVKQKHIHTISGNTGKQEELYAYTYDHAGRLLKVTHKLNEGTDMILLEQAYDEIGRVKSLKKAGIETLKSVYSYDVRSWIKSITNSHFSQTLFYEDTFAGSTKMYNGNISAMSWKLDGDVERSYIFTYDNLSRLKHAAYNKAASGGVYNTSYTYDNHGNIKNLVRRGKSSTDSSNNVIIDELSMTYSGNQLIKTVDGGTTVNLPNSGDFKDYSKGSSVYQYNNVGALIKDTHKGISEIQYNLLHLPQRVDIKNPVAEARIEYIYSATGEKLRVEQKWNPNYSTLPVIGSAINVSSLTQSKATDYIGNKIYEDGQLKRVLANGGYYDVMDKKYYFFLTDHQGNNRIVADQNGTVVQKNHYYPFGVTFAESTADDKQPYKYNGKELNNSHGLNLYDYHARQYEPAIGRFSSMDPLAEKYYSISPYAYVRNNPVNRIDPDGMDEWEINKKTGQISWIKESDTHQLFALDNSGVRTGSSITIKNRDILDQLSQTMDNFRGQYAKTTSSDVGSIFLFAADHSDVEWALFGSQTKKKCKLYDYNF
ncbi:MAG: RHS repeat-associated core domain-containing protein [Tannerellaceae bacterium]|nr:RHS repeat-associated core domain-containing protein [Tannerellaceae bacterium]